MVYKLTLFLSASNWPRYLQKFMSLGVPRFRERRRIRLPAMAGELGVSVRTMRGILAMGAPHTRLGGLIWFDPDELHVWLDKFNRKGSPGVKRTRGIKVTEATK